MRSTATATTAAASVAAPTRTCMTRRVVRINFKPAAKGERFQRVRVSRNGMPYKLLPGTAPRGAGVARRPADATASWCASAPARRTGTSSRRTGSTAPCKPKQTAAPLATMKLRAAARMPVR